MNYKGENLSIHLPSPLSMQSADDILVIISIFVFQENSFNISCKLSMSKPVSGGGGGGGGCESKLSSSDIITLPSMLSVLDPILWQVVLLFIL